MKLLASTPAPRMSLSHLGQALRSAVSSFLTALFPVLLTSQGPREMLILRRAPMLHPLMRAELDIVLSCLLRLDLPASLVVSLATTQGSALRSKLLLHQLHQLEFPELLLLDVVV